MAEDERMSEGRLKRLEVLGEGDNDWWRMECGEHQNMLHEACREIRRARAAEKIAELGRRSALEHLEAHEKALKAENAALREELEHKKCSDCEECSAD